MYIPKEVIMFILGYIFCPITAYIYEEIVKYRERKKGEKEWE